MLLTVTYIKRYRLLIVTEIKLYKLLTIAYIKLHELLIITYRKGCTHVLRPCRARESIPAVDYPVWLQSLRRMLGEPENRSLISQLDCGTCV
jgi:hypothetical protein